MTEEESAATVVRIIVVGVEAILRYWESKRRMDELDVGYGFFRITPNIQDIFTYHTRGVLNRSIASYLGTIDGDLTSVEDIVGVQFAYIEGIYNV